MRPIKVEYDTDYRFLCMVHYRTHLCALRAMLDQSQRQFAATFGISRSTLASWEALHRPPSPKYRAWLAQRVGVPFASVQRPRQPWDSGDVLRTFEDIGEDPPPF
jgi:transcriptional regulator with XRE-family HTH domain